MKNFEIESTLKTFGIQGIAKEGKLTIKGRSIPENSFHFFTPLIEWSQEYAANPQKETLIETYIEYYNTASYKRILDLFRIFEKIHVDGKSQVKIQWHYEEEDEDMRYAGEDFQKSLDIPFEIISIDEI